MRTGEFPEVIHKNISGSAFNQDIEFVEAAGSFQFGFKSVPAIGETPEKILEALAYNTNKMLQAGHGIIPTIQGAAT
jgi:hypothetical protein